MMNKIPPIIHYCWFGNNALPESARRCIASWKKYCPGYEIRRWDESNFDFNKYEYTKEAYQEKKYAFVSDVARLEIIYEYGGIYLDTDVELIKPIDELLDNIAFVGVETTHIALGLGFGSVPKFWFWEKLLNTYRGLHFYKDDGSLNLKTIPQYTTEILNRYGYKQTSEIQMFKDMTIYPKCYFNPKDYITGEIVISKETYSIHHYDATWWGEKEKKEYEFEQKINRKFGKCGMKIYHALRFVKRNGMEALIVRVLYRK